MGSLGSASSQTSETPADCPLCKILGRETLERTFTVDYNRSGRKLHERFFIVGTKNKKGHFYRLMVVVDSHSPVVSPEAENGAIAELFRFMKAFGVDFAIMESTHATVASHWHRVATDFDPKAEDVKQIGDTDRLEVRFKKAGS